MFQIFSIFTLADDATRRDTTRHRSALARDPAAERAGPQRLTDAPKGLSELLSERARAHSKAKERDAGEQQQQQQTGYVAVSPIEHLCSCRHSGRQVRLPAGRRLRVLACLCARAQSNQRLALWASLRPVGSPPQAWPAGPTASRSRAGALSSALLPAGAALEAVYCHQLACACCAPGDAARWSAQLHQAHGAR